MEPALHFVIPTVPIGDPWTQPSATCSECPVVSSGQGTLSEAVPASFMMKCLEKLSATADFEKQVGCVGFS